MSLLRVWIRGRALGLGGDRVRQGLKLGGGMFHHLQQQQQQQGGALGSRWALLSSVGGAVQRQGEQLLGAWRQAVDDWLSGLGSAWAPPRPQLCLDGIPGALEEDTEREVEDVLRDDDGLMLMGPVPKKKTSHSKKRKRMQGKWIYEKHHVAACEVCGHARLLHNLCTFCIYNKKREKIKSMRTAKKAVDAGKTEETETTVA